MNLPWQKLSFFSLLYFVQGAVFAYVVNFQKLFLTEKGMTKDSLGLFTALLLIPFILKVFLGMLSDRVPFGRWGSRKPYMIIGLGLFALGYLILPGLEPASQFFHFAALSFLASVGLALFDTCADGWAIDVALDNEQSSIQAAMVCGRSFGFIAMSMGFGGLSLLFGYSVIFYVLAGLALTVGAVVLMVPHRPMDGGQLESKRGMAWADFRQLRQPAYFVFAMYGVLYSIASFGTDGLLTLHLSDTQLANNFAIGEFGTFRGMGALVGAYAFARLAPRYGQSQVLTFALALLGAGALLPLLSLPIYLAGGLWGVAWGFQETAFVTVAMGYSRGAWAATLFAIAMIFSNVGTSLGEAVAAPSAGRFGYNVVFVGFALLAWLLILAVPRLAKEKL